MELPYVHPNSLAGLDNRSMVWNDVVEQSQSNRYNSDRLIPVSDPDMGLNELGVGEDVYSCPARELHNSSGSVRWHQIGEDGPMAEALPVECVADDCAETTDMAIDKAICSNSHFLSEQGLFSSSPGNGYSSGDEWVWYDSSDDAGPVHEDMDDSWSTTSFLSYDEISDDFEREKSWVLDM